RRSATGMEPDSRTAARSHRCGRKYHRYCRSGSLCAHGRTGYCGDGNRTWCCASGGWGLLIITSRLTGVRIDAETRTAWVEAGTQWGDVLEKAQGVGLAPLLGSSPGVGAIGYTLGGGIGWLARKYGLASD